MNDIEKAILELGVQMGHEDRVITDESCDLAISALEKQMNLNKIINQLEENKINCKNSNTIFDTDDYVLLERAIEIVKESWSVEK